MTLFPFQPPERPPELHATYASFSPSEVNELGFSAEECARVVAMASKVPGRAAEVFNGRLTAPRGTVNEAIRRARVRALPASREAHWLLDKLFAAITHANGRHWQFDLSGAFSPLLVAEYPIGGHYSWHVDLGAGPTSNRKLSLIVQLSDSRAYAGGAVELMTTSRAIGMPKEQGTVVIFPSYTLHRVTKVSRGKRLALVGWIQGTPFR